MAWQQDVDVSSKPVLGFERTVSRSWLQKSDLRTCACFFAMQVAEMAWQQDVDLYSTANYSVVAALELHARIINAGRSEALLPPGFKFVESLPKPKEGTLWKFDM